MWVTAWRSREFQLSRFLCSLEPRLCWSWANPMRILHWGGCTKTRPLQFGSSAMSLPPSDGCMPVIPRLPQVNGQLIAVCGMADSSSPPEECAAIQDAFHGQDVNAQRMRFEQSRGPTMALCVRHGSVFIHKHLLRDGRVCWTRCG